MSQKSASRPATVERFIQTQEDFQQLGEYLTDISSVHSVASSKIHGSHKEKKSNRPVGNNTIDQRGDHYDSAVVPDTQSFAELQQCPSTIYIKLGSKSFSQLHPRKGDDGESSCYPCTDTDEYSRYSQDSLSMSEEQECVPCDEVDEVDDWKDCICEDNRSLPIPVKMSRSRKIKSGSVVPYSASAKSLVPKTSASRQVVPMSEKPAVVTKDGLVISQAQTTSGVTITEITSSPSMKVPSQLLAMMEMDPSERPVMRLGVTVEATEVVRAEKVLVKGASESNLGPGRRPDKVTRIVRRAASDSNVARVIRVQNQLNLDTIRTESKITLDASLTRMLKPGIGGLREFISSRHLAGVKEGEQPQLNSFIDYFVQCDGLRYLGILEQIELDFEERCKAGLLHSKPNLDKRAANLRQKLADIAEIQPVYQQQDLSSFDFPTLLLNEIMTFPVTYHAKLEAIKKIHDYGLQMEGYWYSELQNGKQVNPTEIYDIATQILAELMGQVFSVLVKLCEHLVTVNAEARKYRRKYTIENLISIFTNIRMLTVDEVGAVGETCGEVMMRISRLKKEVIYDLMTKLYSQINFVDICICRALRAVVPLILHYDIQLYRQSQ